jgi:hypothetical protein
LSFSEKAGAVARAQSASGFSGRLLDTDRDTAPPIRGTRRLTE